MIRHDKKNAGADQSKLDHEGIEIGGNDVNILEELFAKIVIIWIRQIELISIELAHLILN